MEGQNHVEVRQTDEAGNASDAALIDFTLDCVLPLAPSIALTQDTGSSAIDKLTSNGLLTLDGIEKGANVEYSSDGGISWTDAFVAMEGQNHVAVRQIDQAGNISDAALVDFTLDCVAPVAPTVALTQDTGSSATDKITNVGTLDVGGAEAGATVEYSNDSGVTWSGSFAAKEGANSVSIRQTDAAGNVSGVTTLSFTLDTTPPQLNPVGGNHQHCDGG